MPDVAIDTDVLTKCSAFGFLKSALQVVTADQGEASVLGASRFTVPAQLKRHLGPESDDAIAKFQSCLATANVVEPSQAETELAARFELAAQQNSAALDSGESQLVAIAISRGINFLATGDKRAISALSRILPLCDELKELEGKVLCLEQILLLLLKNGVIAAIRKAICEHPKIDKALTICFSCSNESSKPEDWIAGLESYIAALRASAPAFLTTLDS